MRELFHQTLSPACRKIRLGLGEKKLEYAATLERVWEKRPQFLALNPGGEVPFLMDGGVGVSGAITIPEYLEELDCAIRLWPQAGPERTEARRLHEWFAVRCDIDIAQAVLLEKINPRFAGARERERGPDMAAIRGGLDALRRMLDAIGGLSDTRNWLAGDALSWADLAAAALLSALDYIGDVPWAHNEAAKHWYMRIKSRPAFRPLLADAIPGLPPQRQYANLDF